MKLLIRNESKYGLIKPTDSPQIRNWKTIGIVFLVLAFTLPVFRSGGRANLTMIGWILNHTIYGNPVEYVPEESYMDELEGTWIDEGGKLRW